MGKKTDGHKISVPKLNFRKVIDVVNRKFSVKMIAILLATSMVGSALLGLFRDRLLNTMYLNTYPAGIDAYTVAFSVPDFMFLILVSGALSVTFVPVLTKRLVSGEKKGAWETSSSVLNFLGIMTLIASILIMIFADPLVRYVIGPGLDEDSMMLSINMMRIIAINPFLFGISTVLCSIQQAVGRFVFYALAPIMYNIGIIIGIRYFTSGIEIFGMRIFDGGIMGVALGVVLGALLQTLVSIIGLIGLGITYEFKIKWRDKGFRSVLSLLPARSVDQGLDYVNSMVNINLASGMGAGTIRAYQQAQNLRLMPVNLVGVAIATAYFSKMSEDAARRDPEIFNVTFRQAIRAIMFIALPITIISFFARGYVVSFIKNGGSQEISNIFGILAGSIFFACIFHILTRGFYSKQDTKTPLRTSIVAIGLNIIVAIIAVNVFRVGVEGLAIAQFGAMALEVLLLSIILHRKYSTKTKKIFDVSFFVGLAKMIIAGFVTSVVTYVMVLLVPLMATDNSFFITFPKFALITFAGFVTYLTVAYILKIDEAVPFVAKLKKIVFRNVS